nr:hypothetical protein [Micromonospora sp. DSM 115978]
MHDGDANAQLGELLTALIEANGPNYSRHQLASRTRFNRRLITDAALGRGASLNLALALENEFETGGKIVALSELAARQKAERTAGRDDFAEAKHGTGGLAAPNGRTVDTTGEVGPTDRRGLLFTTAVFATGLSDRIARADPPPRQVRELRREVTEIAGMYYSTPLPALLPRVEAGWFAVHRILEKPVTNKVRPALVRVAGQYTFYLAHLASDAGKEKLAYGYLSLAAQHAEECADPLLSGSVAVLDSSLAYFAGDHEGAADIARDARTGPVHPYVAGMLAACQARGAALCPGRQDEARRALDDMHHAVWTGETLPGSKPADAELVDAQTAVVLGHLGEGERAEQHARRALALAAAAGQERETGGILNALARSLLRRDQPEPEQAAAVVAGAIEAVEGQPTG